MMMMAISNCSHFTLDPIKVNQFLTRLMCRKCGLCVATWESDEELHVRMELTEEEKEQLR